VSPYRPRDVLAHERRWIVGAPAQRFEYRGIGLRVAERHRDVARPALVADTANRAAFGIAQEFRFGPRE